MKTILIIGGSSGIGLQLAKDLSMDNQVIATYCEHKMNDNANLSYHQLDVMQSELDFSFLPDVIDSIIYCPGSIQLKPFGRFTPTDFIDDYQLNVIGATKVIQAVFPKLKKSASASIVLFSTVAVQTGMAFHSLVSSSKGAIEGLTRALAAEFAPSIRVNCIAPSLTDTPLASGLLQSEEKKIAAAQRHPMKKIGSSQDIADLASYLVSDKCSWMTGQIIHLDGGMGSIK